MYTQKELTKELKKLKKDEIIEICLKVTRSKEILHNYIVEYKNKNKLSKEEKLFTQSDSLSKELKQLLLEIKNTANEQKKIDLYIKYIEKYEIYCVVESKICQIQKN